MHRAGEWIVFWYGIESRDEIETLIDDALSLGHSFGDLLEKPNSAFEYKSGKEPAHAS